MILGVIGDDFTGSSDIGLMLSASGYKTVQYVGVPDHPAAGDVEAGIISLKSRSTAVTEAVEQSVSACRWLQQQGCRQILFKYCSTFDSTREGNIGPVIDALITTLGIREPVVVCPAVPTVGRTLYQGHLFVFDKLLSESGMENHPITPMTDPDIRRWLGYQTERNIGHLPLDVLRRGDARAALLALADGGAQVIVCDAITMEDIALINQASDPFALMTGGAGLGYRPDENRRAVSNWHGDSGPVLALSGSCSQATRRQVDHHRNAGGCQLKVDVAAIVDQTITPGSAVEWASGQEALPLVFSSDTPQQVAEAQERFGVDHAASILERFFAELARLATENGFRRLICAGGETSGAVVNALGASDLEIGPMIDPGVPALRVSARPLVLALKSGNFGADDFFHKAALTLGSSST